MADPRLNVTAPQPGAASQAQAVFYFDLASPLCYLAAERVLHELPLAAEWQPVLARELLTGSAGAADERSKVACRQADDAPPASEHLRAQVQERAAELGLQPLRWPVPFPFDSELAMRVATYAKQIGRAVAFAQAAFRQCYAGGRSLQERDSVVIAAAACEMHPAAVLRAAQLRAVSRQLERTTARAARAGVRELPAIVLAAGRGGPSSGDVFQGEHALTAATAALRARDAGGGGAAG